MSLEVSRRSDLSMQKLKGVCDNLIQYRPT